MKNLCTLLLVVLLVGCVTGGKAPAVTGLMSLDEALAGAAADVGSRVREMTEIAIAGLDAPLSEVADFLTDELSTYLVNSGKFKVLERGSAALAVLDEEHRFQMSGMVSDESAVGIGHYLGAKVMITGSFIRFANFSQLRLRAIDVRTAQILTLYTVRVRPDDVVLASVMRPLDSVRPVAITENALAYLNRGEDLIREGRYDDAIRELDRALAINKDLADGYLYRGVAYAMNEDFDRAIADFTTALRIKPDYYDTLYNRGTTYMMYKRDYDRAIADYTAALRIKPDYHEALSNRGVAYFMNGDNDRAIADYTAALGIKPDYYPALYNRGNAYFMNGDNDRAIADYTAALRIKPDIPEALYNRGVAYYLKYDYDRAIADYEALLRINPNYPNARSNIEVVRMERTANTDSLSRISRDFVIEGKVFVSYKGNSANVTIPEGVTAIGEFAFRECTGLTSVTIPSSVTSIGECAFQWCTGLASVTIPSSVTSIGDGAFSGCTGLTSVTILSGVKTIGDGAFYECTNLTSVTIPSSVTSIGEYAFYWCDNLRTATVSRRTRIGEDAFPDTTRIIYSD